MENLKLYIKKKNINHKFIFEDHEVTKELIDKHFSTEQGYGKHKNIALNLLKNTIEILNEFNINYTLISGTLLGIIRHNDLIPWDDDMDLLVGPELIKHIDKIEEKYGDKINFLDLENGTIKMCYNDKVIEIDHEHKNHIIKQDKKGTKKYYWPFIDLFMYKNDNKNNKIIFFQKEWDKNKFFPVIKRKFYDFEVNLPNKSDYFLSRNFGENYNTTLVSNRYSHKNEMKNTNNLIKISLNAYNKIVNRNMDDFLKDFYMRKIRSGADVKILQYEQNAKVINDKQIVFNNLMKNNTKESNCLMINIEKDVARYKSGVSELRKLNLNNFVHLKATYWKEKNNLETDLNLILNFLRQFNSDIKSNIVTIDDFSHCSDSNIILQDGPLACYCSHLRAMMYGYINFENYTIITEDDLMVANTEYIEKYIKLIPDDWDVICLNSIPKNKLYDEPYYKFDTDFHSGHFYIIRNRVFPIIFKNMYPIKEQVDVLLSNLINEINIYNIPDTVYQKNYSSNTQNNLYEIYRSDSYSELRTQLNNVKTYLKYYINKFLPDNESRNSIICSNLIFNILYLFITNNESLIDKKLLDNENIKNNFEDYLFDDSELKKESEYLSLCQSIFMVLSYTKKGIDVNQYAYTILNNMIFIIKKFILHNTIDQQTNELIKAYSFGSTCQTYIIEKNKVIIKQYNDKLRWISDEHNNVNEIFQREVNILRMVEKAGLIKNVEIDEINKIIRLRYYGESLYNEFNLPSNWKEQINRIFDIFDKNGIYYPEFRLENILVIYNRITLIDYGLSQIRDEKDKEINKENREKFINSLEKIENKFKNVSDRELRNILYYTFMKNLELN